MAKKDRKMKVLYNARRLKDLSQQDLADKFNVTTVTIRNWETGNAKPNIHNLILLSEILDVSLDDIMNDYKEEQE